MKKNLYYGVTALACFAVLATFAEAKHGYKHDTEGTMNMQEYDKGAKKVKDMAYWQQKKANKIQEEYNDAIEEIRKSGLTTEQKLAFEKQAAENRDLANQQLQERVDLMKKHEDTIKNMNIPEDNKKDLKDVVEEIRDIF